MDRRQQTDDRLNAVEAVDIERHQRDNGLSGIEFWRHHEMHALAVGQLKFQMGAALGVKIYRSVVGRQTGLSRKRRPRRRENDASGVFLGEPEDRGFGRPERGPRGEIATPSYG